MDFWLTKVTMLDTSLNTPLPPSAKMPLLA